MKKLHFCPVCGEDHTDPANLAQSLSEDVAMLNYAHKLTKNVPGLPDPQTYTKRFFYIAEIEPMQLNLSGPQQESATVRKITYELHKWRMVNGTILRYWNRVS